VTDRLIAVASAWSGHLTPGAPSYQFDFPGDFALTLFARLEKVPTRAILNYVNRVRAVVSAGVIRKFRARKEDDGQKQL
jgi:hypothetical protein